MRSSASPHLWRPSNLDRREVKRSKMRASVPRNYWWTNFGGRRVLQIDDGSITLYKRGKRNMFVSGRLVGVTIE